MRALVLCISIFYCSCVYTIPNISTIDPSHVVVILTHELKNCFITFVEIKGKIYLVKQKKDPKKRLSVVKDALASYIAKPFDIAQSVEIIPTHVDFPGKMFPWPATIHSVVPGNVAHKYGKICLKQFWKPYMSIQDRGLTRRIIKDMVRHVTLAKIVALDTIIGNSDRHSSNLFYDVITDSFCAIDMDDTFNKDLCAFNYKKLCKMVQETDHPFSYQEIQALRIYRDMLKKIVSMYTPHHIKGKLRYFARKAGVSSAGRAWARIIFFEQMITRSWASAYNLIDLLDKITLIAKS